MRDHCRAALTMSLHRPHRPEADPHPGRHARTPVDLRPRRARTGAEAQRTTGRLRAWVSGCRGMGLMGAVDGMPTVVFWRLHNHFASRAMWALGYRLGSSNLPCKLAQLTLLWNHVPG